MEVTDGVSFMAMGGGNCGWWWREGDDMVQVSDESEKECTKFQPNH